MFTDPQSITVNAVAQSMPRVETNGQKSIYRKADGTFTLTISHIPAGKGSNQRVRSMVRVDQIAVVPDPLTAVNDYETLSIYFVVDRPLVGFTALQVNYLMAAIEGWIDTTSTDKIFGQES